MANPVTAITLANLSTNFGGDGVSTMGANAEPGFWQGRVVYRQSDYDPTQAGGSGEFTQLPYAIVALVARQINSAGTTFMANSTGASATSASQDGATTIWFAVLQRVNVGSGALVGRPTAPIHVSALYTLATLKTALGASGGVGVDSWTDPTVADFDFDYWPS